MSRSAITKILAELEKLGKIGQPRRRGRINNTFDCPFHSAKARQDTPSFGVHMGTGEWNCLNPACGRRGATIQALYAALTGKPQAEVEAAFPVDLGATDDLRGKLSGTKSKDEPRSMAPYPSTEPISKHPEAVAYMNSRRIPPSVWERLGLEYCPHPKIRGAFDKTWTVGGKRIIFPIRLASTMSFMGRSIGPDPTPKWRPLENAGRMFYDPLGLLSDPTDVVLVEGEFSLAACVREGLPTMGCFGSNLGPWRAAALHRFNNILILFDGDKAGNEGRMLAFAEHGRLLKGKLRSFKLPDGHDPASIPAGFGPTIRAKLTETVPFSDTLKERFSA